MNWEGYLTAPAGRGSEDGVKSNQRLRLVVYYVLLAQEKKSTMRIRPLQNPWTLSLIITATGLSLATLIWAQERTKPNESTDPMLRGFEFRSIGPATMMGRLDDIVGTEKDPMLLYIGFATGGVWKSTDGGLYWHSQFDNMPNESIGSIAIAPSDPNVVYVGTGEPNNRQSSSIGDGVWGTTDGGKTWAHLGLEKYAVDRTRGGGSYRCEDRLRCGQRTFVWTQ